MKEPIFRRTEWSWDKTASYGYNVIAKFEETLINLGIMDDFSDIEVTEGFDHKWSLRDDIKSNRWRVKFSVDSDKKFTKLD